MATTTNGNLERGDYKNVALEEEDVVEMKKQLATGSSKDVHQSVSSCECSQSAALARCTFSSAFYSLLYSCSHSVLLCRIYSHDRRQQGLYRPVKVDGGITKLNASLPHSMLYPDAISP